MYAPDDSHQSFQQFEEGRANIAAGECEANKGAGDSNATGPMEVLGAGGSLPEDSDWQY